jgi:hypothetical protein
MPASVRVVDRPSRLELYRDGGRRWRWRVISKGGFVLEISERSFTSEGRASAKAKAKYPSLPIINLVKAA